MKVNTQSVNFNADKKLIDFIQKRLDKLDLFYDKVNKKHILPTDETYFCNKSFTISYSPLYKNFISFHSFTPNY